MLPKKDRFKLIHSGKDRSKDRIVIVHIDDEQSKVEFENIPPAIGLVLSDYRFFDLRRHTYSCLMLAINQIKDVGESLRPSEEILQALNDQDASSI